MPPNPNADDWAKHSNVRAPLAWLHGDQEYYPVWSTTLWEQDQIWSSKFGLRSSEERVERLAQEAALYVICIGLSHES